MAIVTRPPALDESINTTEQTPRNIADVLAEELARIAENILPPNAEDIAYDNTESGLVATNVQDAIDEVISSQADVIADTMADLTENKTATVTDGVADFETIDGSLVKSLVVEIEPSQSGSGTPSPDNIRPIIPWTQEDVTVVGKNRLENTGTSKTENGITWTVNTDGSVSAVGTASSNSLFVVNTFDFVSGVSYILNGCPEGGAAATKWQIQVLASLSASAVAADTGNGVTLDSFSGTYYIRCVVRSGNTVNFTFYPMIRLATESDATYEPYKGKTYTTPFGQTVYGGTLDVLTGELTIDKGFVTLNGTETWNKYQSTNKYYADGLFPNNSGDTNENAISSHYPFRRWMNGMSDVTNDNMFYLQNGIGRVAIMDDDYTTVDALKAMLSANNMEIVYPLATPTTVQLTPQTVKSLVGENHISASTGDVLECKFSMLINGDDLEMLLS